VHLTLDLVAGTLCGTAHSGGLGCDASVCLTPAGVSGSNVTCSGQAACLHDNACTGGKVCVGLVCAAPSVEGGFCSNDGSCAQGSTCFAGTVCYKPRSKAAGQVCHVEWPDHCQAGDVCAGVCLPQVTHGDTCSDSRQCPSGMSCERLAVVNAKVCVLPLHTLALGQTCAVAPECTSGACVTHQGRKRCDCTTAWCLSHPANGAPQYCGTDGDCHALKSDGATCCAAGECRGGACTVSQCAVTGLFGGKTGASQGHCWTPWSADIGETCYDPTHCARGLCIDGTCECVTDVDCNGPGITSPRVCRSGACQQPQCLTTLDCASDKRCDPATLTCVPKLGEWASCWIGQARTPADCASGRCGLIEPKCYAWHSQQARDNDPCVDMEQCDSNLCQPSCSSPASVFDALKNKDWAALVGAGCSFRCACAADGDCASGTYCGAYEVSVGGVPLPVPWMRQCRSKGAVGATCSSGGQCASGVCRGATDWTPGTCGCSSNGQCASGRYCSGNVCVLKKLNGVGCGSDGECVSGNCDRDCGTCPYDWTKTCCGPYTCR
jgi:hypothetical protein